MNASKKPAAKPAPKAAARKPATPRKPAPPAAPAAPAPQLSFAQQMLQSAASRGAGLEEIDRYIAMVERETALEREKAHTAAKAALAAEDVQLVKDKRNEDFGNAYISIGKLVQTMRPLLAKHGLTADWDIDQSKGNEITVTAILAHALGHKERVSLTVPRDVDDRKNDLQAIKSSLTYARSMTFESVCGLAASEASIDDDGNGAGRLLDNIERPSIVIQAAEAADKGLEAYAAFFSSCTTDQRRQLAPWGRDLEARAKRAGK